MNHNKEHLSKLILASLMAALVCIATFSIHIPTGNGYIHPGDAIVILSGVLLGPIYGPLAAGIGSMFADIFASYPQYAAITFILKALVALAAALLYRKGNIVSLIISGIVGGFIVTAGYFLFDGFLYNFGASLKSVLPNLLQNTAGIVISVLLYRLLRNIPQFKDRI